MIIVSYAAGGAIEVLFAIVRKEDIAEGFLVTGLIFPLVLPPTMPLWMVGVSVAFGVLVGKEVFGGTGRNLFNPALVGRCFALLAYPKAMAAGGIEPIKEFPGRLLQYVSAANVDAITEATPLGLAKQGLWDRVELSDLFFGAVSGSAGETCALAIIIGGVFLLVTRVGNWRTVVSILGAFVLTTACLHLGEDKLYKLVPWHLCAGGILFGAFFMATDPVSSPMTNGGKWMYGIVIGVVAVLIRNLTGYVEGVMFAILLGNIVAPVLDELVIYVHQRGLRNER
jgi:Na+-transporting NADH:ubiquinone oxidoreductase subunit B/electron transport complex protein RnfD